MAKAGGSVSNAEVLHRFNVTIPDPDTILYINEEDMLKIRTGYKDLDWNPPYLPPSCACNFEPTVQRIWFYEGRTSRSIQYICKISQDDRSQRFRIDSLWELKTPVTIAALKKDHGFKVAPSARSMPVALPESLYIDTDSWNYVLKEVWSHELVVAA